MREPIYFGKFDKWISGKIVENSWASVCIGLIWLGVTYPIMYFLPQIAFYVNGTIISHNHHYGWTMKWFGFMSLVLAVLIILKIIRLLFINKQ